MKKDELAPLKGAFITSLERGNKDIKKDRAASIAEEAEMVYRRTIENMKMDLKKLKRERETMLDLSPTNTHSLILGGDFQSDAFVEKDLAIGIKMRLLKIKITDAEERYEFLFGDSGSTEPTTTVVDDAVLGA